MSVRDTLAQRAETHGGFVAKSSFIQQFKADMRGTMGWKGLADDQKEALDHIATKVGRILFGNADHHDNWHDVAGYATLIADRLAARIEAGTDETAQRVRPIGREPEMPAQKVSNG